jgi:membrane dipeptidase
MKQNKSNHKFLSRFFKICTSAIVFIALFLFIFGSYLLKWAVNPVISGHRLKVSEEAKVLHTELIIADMHADSLLYNNSLLKRSISGQIDLPRLLAGNVALQVFTAVTKYPLKGNVESNEDSSDILTPAVILQHWPMQTWGNLTERALYQAKKLKDVSAKSDGQLQIILNKDDLRDFLALRTKESNIVGAILGIEGGHALEGKLENLDLLYNAGYRLMSPTHFFDNELGGSMHGSKKGGLTDFGQRVIKRMEELNMVIDLAHASSQMIDDVISMVNQPVIVSHTGVKGINDNNRNLSDEQIIKIAKTGGVIGIGFWDTAIGSFDIQDIARSVRYVSDLVGVEHVGIGSDFDGAVRTPIDASEMSQITEALLREGFNDQEIKLIMGENFLKLLDHILPQ